MDSHYTYDKGPNKPPTTFVFGPLYLASRVYQLSPPEVSLRFSLPKTQKLLPQIWKEKEKKKV